jgi:hypothetical protein
MAGTTVNDEIFEGSSYSSADGSKRSQTMKDQNSVEGNEGQVAVRKIDDLVREESRAVHRSKIFVITVILLAGVIGSVLAALFVKRGEEADFAAYFYGLAIEIQDVSAYTARQSFAIIKSFSTAVTVSALQDTPAAFPFVTLPYFHVQAEEAREQSRAEVVVWAPLVKAEQKAQWEQYAIENQDWIREGLDYRGMPNVDPGTIPSQIYSYKDEHNHDDGEVHVPGYYLPVWQTASAPINASIVNLDLLTRSSYEHVMIDVEAERHAILSDICDFSCKS